VNASVLPTLSFTVNSPTANSTNVSVTTNISFYIYGIQDLQLRAICSAITSNQLFTVYDNNTSVSLNSLRVTVSNGAQIYAYTVASSDLLTQTVTRGQLITVSHNAFLYNQRITVNAFAVNSLAAATSLNYFYTTIAPPVLAAAYPVSGAVNVPTSSSIVAFTITDATTDIDISSLRVTINGVLATQNIYSGTLRNYRVTVNPTNYDYGVVMSVSAQASDIKGNPGSISYTFTTAPDIYKPTLSLVSPLSGATSVPITSSIVFDALEDLTDIDFSSVSVTVNGLLVGSISSANIGTRNYRITVDPADYAYGAVIPVLISVKDLKGNTATRSYSFTAVQDITAPTVTMVTPAIGLITYNSGFIFEVVDTETYVNLSSVTFAVGAQSNTYNYTVVTSSIANGYRYTISPTGGGRFFGGEIVTLAITVADNRQNTTNSTSIFSVIYESVAPAIVSVLPTSNSSLSAYSLKQLTFILDNTLLSAPLAGAEVFYNGKTYHNGDGKLTITSSGDLRIIDVLDNFFGDNPNQMSAQASSPPQETFATVNAINASGLSIGAYSYSFTVIFDVIVDSLSIPFATSVPTVFNPNAGEKTDIVYVLKSDKDITVRIYDLSGYRLFETKCSAGTMGGKTGNNRVIWDGRDDAGRLQGNGVYVFFILDGTSIVYKGKIVISNR